MLNVIAIPFMLLSALPTTQTGQWTSFSILKAPEEQETQDSTAQARFSELSQRKTRQLEAVDKNQKQLKFVDLFLAISHE